MYEPDGRYPRVSVITPCYNGSAFLGRTIESVQGQTFVAWELVVVDDGSTDASADLVSHYARTDRRIRLVQKPNGGVSSARNAGYRAASAESEYLLFLDADDCLEEEMLAEMVAYLDSHPSVGMAHCDYKLIDETDDEVSEEGFGVRQVAGASYHKRFVASLLGVRTLPLEAPETPFVSLYSWPWIIPSIALIRRRVYDQTSGWDEPFGQPCEDADLFMRIGLLAPIHYVPAQLTLYRTHPTQAMKNKERLHRQEEKLYRKWRLLEGLNSGQGALRRQAWRFRNGRLLPCMWLSWGVDALRAGKPAGAVACWAQGAKQLLRFAIEAPRVR